MDDALSGIGAKFHSPPFRLQQLAALHLSDCPDKYTLLDQCSHCCPAHRPWSTPSLGYAPSIQHGQRTMQRMLPRSYAEVASTSPPPHGARSPPVPPSTLSTAPVTYEVEQQWRNTANVAATNSQNGSPRTWAEVAYDPTHPPVTQYPVQLPMDSSFLEVGHGRPLHQSHAARSSPQPGPSRRPRMEHSNGHGGPTLLIGHANQRPQVAAEPPPFTAGQPPSYEGLPTVPQHNSPRDVNHLIQQTSRGGHRQQPPTSPHVATPTSMPMSPGTLSVASSSQWSKVSSRRRTVQQLRASDPLYPHKCEQCGKRFAKPAELTRHESTHAGRDKRRHPCRVPGCDWRFVNPKDLKRHFDAMHASTDPATKPLFMCPYAYIGCPKSYPRADNLRRHIRNAHQQDSAYVSQSRSRTASSHTTLS